MDIKKISLILLLTTLSFYLALAQQFKISGTVSNANTKKPIPFANIYLKNSLKGTVSNDDGQFELSYAQAKDTLIVSAVGFISQSFAIGSLKKKVNIKLIEDNIQIKEVSVKPKKSRSYALLELIHEHEKENNTYHFTGIEGKEYNRTAIVFKNIDNKIKNNILFRSTPGAFIDDSDTTCAVPVLIEEVVNRFLVPADGSDMITERLLQQSNSLDVFAGADMDDITNEMTISQNFYKQFIPLLGKNFVSPIALTSRFYYKMWVMDSVNVNGVKQIRIDFRPRRPKDIAFFGYFWVETESYAITEMNVRLSDKANINYVQDVRIHNTYEKNLEGKWYFKKKKTEMVINYSPQTDTLKTINTYISKVTGYRDIRKTTANEFSADLVMKKKIASIEQLNEEELRIFWNKNRFEALDTTEQQIYNSIDSLKENTFAKAFDKTVTMMLIGYWQQGIIDIGPFLDIYRRNKLEGVRLTAPLRTSKLFSENFTVGGYLGYGFTDEKLKYGVNTRINLPANTYSVLGVDAWWDVRKIGHNENLSLIRENSYGSGEDNIVSSIAAIRINDKISEKKYASIWYERDIKKGVTIKPKLIISNTIGNQYVPFVQNGTDINSIYQIAGSFNVRFSFHENYLDEYFKRIYMGNRYPILNFYFEGGATSVGNQTNPYFKIHSTIKHKVSFGMGQLQYLAEAGTIFGSVPFPFLEVHRGNETFGYARYNFNMLNYLEYVSDIYLNVHAKYNFGGFFLNNIPLLRSLNLREMVSFKGILGGVSNKHQEVLDFPGYTSGVINPYGEFGVGLTNIFKYGRIEYVWRLSDKNKPGTSQNGIRFRFEAYF